MSEKIKSIAAAQRVTDRTFSQILTFLKPGVSEKEAAAEVSRLHLANGADGIPPEFPPIVAFGSGTADVHHVPSDRKLRQGDLVMIDLGCQVNGYRSDMTRMAVLGSPHPEVLKVLRIVRRAQTAALKAVKAGMPVADLDAVARNLISQAGYGKRFVHSLGHGVGRNVHQQPNVSPRGRGALKAGMVITIEPGIYLPGRFGIRIEDLVVVTPRGMRNLTQSPKHLHSL